MQYSRVYDFVTCYLYPFMFSQGGDIWDPATGQVEGILNSDINATAMTQMKDWLRYQPPGATNFGIAEQIDVFHHRQGLFVLPVGRGWSGHDYRTDGGQ